MLPSYTMLEYSLSDTFLLDCISFLFFEKLPNNMKGIENIDLIKGMAFLIGKRKAAIISRIILMGNNFKRDKLE